MLGCRVTCPKCRETFDAAEEDEELFGAGRITAARARAADDLAKSPAAEETLERSSGRLGMVRRGEPPLTAIAAAAFFVPWSSLVALVADINLNPFADTPDTIMTQEIPLLRELTDLDGSRHRRRFLAGCCRQDQKPR